LTFRVARFRTRMVWTSAMRTGPAALALLCVAVKGVLCGAQPVPPRLATTPADFVQPGSQPSAALDNFAGVIGVCENCHGDYPGAVENEPWNGWTASVMAQASRDPVMRAAAALANVDAAGSAEMCIRCHAPIGWLGGRSTGGLFENLLTADLEGVACNVCHRLVDPITRPDAPASDAAILADLGDTRPSGACRGNPAQPCIADADCGAAVPCDVDAGGGRFVVDPAGDVRRGPYEITGFNPHPMVASPYHRRADVCAPCHDVSTPTFSRQPDGTYALNRPGEPHPTERPQDMFPEQRTFSEWRASDFARGGVVFADGRFGGALTATRPNQVPVATCQDCHMPDVRARGCNVADPRPDLGTHGFAGANTWVVGAVEDEYGAASRLTDASVQAAHDRTTALLAAAADLDATQDGAALHVRVTNQTGHKLPTGYPEGRRMWLAVRFFVGDGAVPVAEDGRYDDASATLDVAHTAKIYETRHELDDAVGAAAGLPGGTRFHLVLSNRIAFDDRIPPRGFGNAAFAAAGAAPAGYTYADGQHWDDTTYALPPRATRAEVTLRYQTTTREYAEFLRDATADDAGLNAWARWQARGQSAPADMAHVVVALTPACGAEAPFCCGEPAGTPCDDADACTGGDACADGVCGGTLASVDAVQCELGRLTAPGLCAEPLPKKLRTVVAKRVRSARAALIAAQRKPGSARARKLLRKAARALAPIAKRVEASVTGPARASVSAPCATEVQRAVGRAVDALGVVAP
jgi:cytochrome c554/c'-like protein